MATPLLSILCFYIKAALQRPHLGGKTNIYDSNSKKLNNVCIKPTNLTHYKSLFGLKHDSQLPHIYPHLLAFELHLELLLSNNLPFRILGLVHIRNEFTQYRYIEQDEILNIVCTLENFSEVDRGIEIDIVTKVVISEKLVWESTLPLLHPMNSSEPIKPIPKPKFLQPEIRLTWNLEGNTGREYAKVSGDINPIHLHSLFSKPFGLKKPIAHGMWVNAKILADLGDKLPSPPFRMSTEFRLPLYLPGKVSFEYSCENMLIDFHIKNERNNLVYVTGGIESI